MKPRDSLLKARLFELEEKRRKLGDLGSMIADFRRMAADLDQQIEAEHQRTGVRDVNHFAYPPFAKAARLRRDKLLNSVGDLVDKLDAARTELTEIEAEVKAIEQPIEAVEERSRFSRRPTSRARGHQGAKSPA